MTWVPCCQAGLGPQREDHSWLDPKVIQELPLNFRTGEQVDPKTGLGDL